MATAGTIETPSTGDQNQPQHGQVPADPGRATLAAMLGTSTATNAGGAHVNGA